MPSIPSPAKQTPITLSSTGWADNQQSVSVPGVLADETKQLIMACAASASSEDWDAAEIQLASQAADSVTFSCTTTPTSNLSGYVVVMEVEA